MKILDLAGSAIKGAFDMAGNCIDTINEDRDMSKYIDEVNTMCRDMGKEFEQLKEKYFLDFEREHAEYEKITAKIAKQQEKYSDLQALFNTENSVPNHEMSTNDISLLSAEMNNKIEPGQDSSLWAGGAAGLATGAGTVGLMTAFGTAGTGAALSSLTGTAYIHATLAALGGGSLATGGFGMIGGALTLGAAVLAPAAIVTGYVADKKIRKAYEEAKERENKSKKFHNEAVLFFRKCNRGLEIFRYINREMYSFVNFFTEIINASVAARALKKNEKYHVLVRQCAETLASYERLSFLDKAGKLNENIIDDLASVRVASDKCHKNFYNYYSTFNAREKELLDDSKTQDLVRVKENEAVEWSNRRQNYIVRNETIRHEFDKALNEAKQELDIISAWVNFHVVDEKMQEKFEKLLQKGVTIKIIYGIGNMNDNTPDEKNRKTLEVIRHLKRRFATYPNFKTKCQNTHEKLFICDERFYVSSSFNVLSFDGKYKKRNVRSESGEASGNIKLLREYRRTRFDF